MSAQAKLLREKIAAAHSPKLRAIDAKEVVVGKDVLELLSSAMYVDPMSVYREYVQNAADAIDEARETGVLGKDEDGRIDIHFDPVTRSVTIRDNGTGIPSSTFARRLTRVGASEKRGQQARGFRGVGRLAGLGYAQELVFRSRSRGELSVSEMRWDCKKLRTLLRAREETSLPDIIAQVVTHGQVDAVDRPPRFFEVEMRGVVRLKADRLMDPTAVENYLGQVAPIPFKPDFPFAEDIAARLDGLVDLGNLQIHVDGKPEAIRRPHVDGFALDETRAAQYSAIEFFDLPATDGEVAAVAWVLHHDYEGAVPNGARVKGLRLRVGNVQVGDTSLLEELFPEARFNSWSVGEVHVLDRRIVPNGRRDQFEQNTHYANLLNHLAPIAREISKRCRNGSVRRKLLKDFKMHQTAGEERLAILRQGAVAQNRRETLVRECWEIKERLDRIAASPMVLASDGEQMSAAVVNYHDALTQVETVIENTEPLATVAPDKRPMYEHMFELIYSCSTNRVAAKALVDRILEKIA